MISQLRYTLKIVAPTLLWSGILVALLAGGVLFYYFHHASRVDAGWAGFLAELLTPLIAAFFAAGVLDAEMKRGAHELLLSKQRPLWQTVTLRLGVSLLLALLVGAAMLGAVHYGIRRIPVGMLLLAAFPSSLCMAAISLWARVRLGNVFIGYIAALAVWLGSFITGLLLGGLLGLQINPLLTLTGYTDRLLAEAAGAVETTPYVDWWWVSKLALVAVSAAILFGVGRRVELLVEGD